MNSPATSRAPWWLYCVLVLATAAVVLSVSDLVPAAYSAVTQENVRALSLLFPASTLLLGVLAWIVALPRVRFRGRSLSPPRAANWLALLLGACGALLGGAELYAGLADAGIAALADFPVPLFVLLALWCAFAGGSNLLSRG